MEKINFVNITVTAAKHYHLLLPPYDQDAGLRSAKCKWRQTPLQNKRLWRSITFMNTRCSQWWRLNYSYLVLIYLFANIRNRGGSANHKQHKRRMHCGGRRHLWAKSIGPPGRPVNKTFYVGMIVCHVCPVSLEDHIGTQFWNRTSGHCRTEEGTSRCFEHFSGKNNINSFTNLICF